MKSYEDYVVKYSSRFVRVLIDIKYCNQIIELVEKITEAKSSESHHLIDSRNEKKRFMTGLLGEAALEKLLGIEIIDWSVGNSSLYHRPDILDYSVGVKTVERDKFPIIFKENSYPQIICVRKPCTNAVFVCGLATVEVLNTFQDDSLILDENLRRRGTKTGFYGFDKLIPIRSLEDLKYAIKTKL